ncbi:MAG: metallophosphoesterase [Treponema sp.]|jgi:3',5'-cyclic AMP phosphodiesterase CpdA|nr:metallophosphoesterase [Treponema sp.]
MKQSNQKPVLLIAVAFLCAVAFSCAKEKTAVLKYDYNTRTETPPAYPDAFFSVISDTHLYDSSLGSGGAAFEKTMNSDRKLLLDSQDLLDYAINGIIASQVNFVLVSGDLTKDGELVNHIISAQKLKKLTGAGIPVFVVPGNHDINNPDAVRYNGDAAEPVASISADDFARIYGNFGYNAAILRDNDSLSYVAEPVEGLWLLALDACRYRENVPGKHEIVSGKISQKTADWTADVLREASDKNKAVIAVMHHGAVEHWDGQRKLHPDYLIQDYASFGNFLASWNVRVIFTGHYHAQDVTRGEYNGKPIYDIETGSLVTATCPVRYVDIKNNEVNIRTETIVDRLYPGTAFAPNAIAFVKKTVMLEAESVLRNFKVSEKDIAIITDAVGDAFNAHYNGDENPSLRKSVEKSKLGLWGRFVLGQQQYVLDGLWADLKPADNHIKLQF